MALLVVPLLESEMRDKRYCCFGLHKLLFGPDPLTRGSVMCEGHGFLELSSCCSLQKSMETATLQI